MSSRDDLPRALPSLWRAIKRGYQAEPMLLTVSFGLSLLYALPDALLALWLKLLADGVLNHDRGSCAGRGSGSGRLRDRDLVLARGGRSNAATLSRSFDHRPRVSCGLAPGIRGDDRAPRASAVPESSGRPPQPGFCSRPHVHVAVRHVRLGTPACRDRGTSHVGSPGARIACTRRDTHRADVRLAPGSRARRKSESACQPTCPPPLRDSHHGATGEGGPGHRHWRATRQGPPRRLGAVVWSRRRARDGAPPSGMCLPGQSSERGSWEP